LFECWLFTNCERT